MLTGLEGAKRMIYLYHSDMLGAPQLTQTPGAGIAVLDVLVNGFGAGTVDSIIVANGIATVTRSAGHPFERDAVALIAGATPAALNGEKKVLGVTPTAYTFAAPGVANQTATGSITHKLAGAGWTKAFTGTHTAAYKSSAAEATGCLLRVDDTDGQVMRCVGYESMTDIDSGSGPFPAQQQIAGGGWWPKIFRHSASTDAAPWFIAADDRFFYLRVQFYSSGAAQTVGFGDFVPTKNPDAYACMLVAAPTGHTTGTREEDAGAVGANAAWVARSFTGLGGAAALNKAAAVPGWMGWGGQSGTFGIPFPNSPDNKLYTSVMTLSDAAFSNYRGNQPGALALCHPGLQGQFPQGEVVENVAGYEGRRFRVMNNSVGAFLIDVTGPWR
jgi:hypothetical protein